MTRCKAERMLDVLLNEIASSVAAHGGEFKLDAAGTFQLHSDLEDVVDEVREMASRLAKEQMPLPWRLAIASHEANVTAFPVIPRPIPNDAPQVNGGTINIDCTSILVGATGAECILSKFKTEEEKS
ncbi:MAG: hypothetical protein QM488_18410 [Rhizobiaceae bacterium]